MITNTKRSIAALVAAASLGGAGWAIAAGSSDSGSSSATTQQTATTTTSPNTSTSPQTGSQRPARPTQTPVTGETAEKIKAAVLAKEPGATIDRIEKDPQGYHAHITKKDGTDAVARLNAQLEVTSVEAGRGGPGGKGGPGGPGGQRSDETPLTGENAEKAKAAALAKLPGSTIVRVETEGDGDGVYEAHVTKADGSPATVIFDKDFKVIEVKER